MAIVKKQITILRTCAHCEWIFKAINNNPACPKCGFCSYGARSVYGRKAYKYAKTQEPWKTKKMRKYSSELDLEIKTSNNQEVKTQSVRYEHWPKR